MLFSEARAEKITDADHKAHYEAIAKHEHKRKVEAWLQADPSIGVLNSGRYYRIVDGESVFINELEGAA